ncbi:DNA polymerase III subunit beta [Patescibacteria group bacterium]|nr:DNA polymerase III subunit beta [Patescibacteria group bacterium]MBU1472175.1 DNA polymerase III subunit beta [Patescibacteria group bacterium]MBU2459569.1 DNA polymerase III subunit beta [Patescibacteria group bacterium]MBU2544190.1 DNA polymerase III subunit beta [Patescibacteria group bacterium]
MNISLLQENLLKALTRTGRIVSTRPQIPIAGNVLLDAKNGGLSITSTNLETSETVWVGGKAEKEGSVCVPSRLLTELVSSFPAETVHLVVKDEKIHISCSGFSATIPGVPAGEFPPVEPPPKGGEKINKETLVGALSLVLFAAATDEGRPLLTGIKMVSGDGGTTLAATDGYRLSTKTIAFSLKQSTDMVIPARTLSEVLKISLEEKDAKDVVVTAIKDGQLIFSIGDTNIMTRLIAGDYPDYKKIIPKAFNTRALLEKEPLARAVKSAAIFARDNANIVRFTLDKQRVIVSANTPNVGENRIEIDAKIDGEGGEIAFNSRFLLEFLSAFPGDEVLFEMTGALNPGVFRPVKDDSYLHIIMPVRITS